VFSRDEAIAHFDLANVNPAPASPPYSKLDWLNGVYLRQLPTDELARRLYPVLHGAGLEVEPETVRAITPLIQERIKTLHDAIALTDFFFEDEIVYDSPEALIGKKMDVANSLHALQHARATLAQLPTLDEEALETALRALAEELGLKAGQLFGIIRVAVTAKKVSPPLFGTLAILKRERVLARMEQAEDELKSLAAHFAGES
jgi:glutamyl-tRNA synthetase